MFDAIAGRDALSGQLDHVVREELKSKEALTAMMHDEWRLYRRSASDDKAPIVAMLAALDALREAGISPSVNLKFFLEGEEGDLFSTSLYESSQPVDIWILSQANYQKYFAHRIMRIGILRP